ncbi:PqqD family protein [uncultured Eubacterium sp.]|uniref:PqqD family protein n=1 Tax=uncultured Eubacterium sp. TaxID=165185 RepID=UPI0015AF2211|nr:PqqD family protein [uncultured Eubacterium sp.]
MKLKDGIVLGNIDGQDFAIATGSLSSTLSGIINNNESANYIFKLLQKEQTEQSIISAMLDRYDAPEDEIKADVKEFLATLDTYGVLEK